MALMTSYPVFAIQDSQSLYSYVMNTFGEQYVDIAAAKEKLELLQQRYNVAMYNNLQADSFDAVKEYAGEVEQELNIKIDETVADLQTAQKEVSFKIEEGLNTLTPKELSALNREYSKYQEEIDDVLADKTSVLSLYEKSTFNRIDVSELETSIREQEGIVGYGSYDNGPYLGELSDLRRPFDGKVIVTSPAGYRTDPIDGRVKFHNATDYAMPVGTNLYAVFNGTVIRSDNRGDGYGESIKIDCGNGIILHYAHMSKRFVEVGDVVKQNQVIGKSGNTGRSTGPHLHMSLFYNGEVLDIEELYR